MIPETGDIWQFEMEDPYDHSDTEPILIHEFLYDGFRDGDAVYLGMSLTTGIFDEYLFNPQNMIYWRKLG